MAVIEMPAACQPFWHLEIHPCGWFKKDLACIFPSTAERRAFANQMVTMNRNIHIGTLALWLLARCAAHMMLEQPTPYGLDTLNNSPLEPSGQDFPCKSRPGVYDLTTMNHWTAGKAQSVRFKGSAVHGGGSCQFSLTTDAQPSKSSRWKVIDSRVGGCPAGASGNLHGGSEVEVADNFEVVLPLQIPDGVYTFAWTWFNRIGNREMYMNCAPITVNGGGDDTTFLDALPDMFVANLPGTDCTTPANFDFVFPHPGDSVVTAKNAKITPSSEGGGCTPVTPLEATGMPTQSSQGLMHSQSSLAFAQPAALDTGRADAESGAQLAATFTRIAAAGPTPDVQSTLVVANNLLVASSTGSDVASSTSNDTPSAASASTSPACIPCSVEGSVVCIDDTDFGLCNQYCAVSQRLAAGTFCLNGSILKHRGH